MGRLGAIAVILSMCHVLAYSQGVQPSQHENADSTSSIMYAKDSVYQHRRTQSVFQIEQIDSHSFHIPAFQDTVVLGPIEAYQILTSPDWSTITNIPTFLTNGDDVDDADNDPTNEIQTFSQNANLYTLSQGGGVIDINDQDASPTNEIQSLGSSASGTNRTITISNGGTATTISVADNDNNPINEIQNLSDGGKTGTTQTINISQGTGTTIDVADLDNDPTNEIQDLSPYQTIAGTTGWDKDVSDDFDGNYNSLTNTPTIPTNNNQLTNGAGYITSPNDADSDPTNELQTATKTGNTVTISQGAGSFDVSDDDNSDTNEIQSLSYAPFTGVLSQSLANTVTLPWELETVGATNYLRHVGPVSINGTPSVSGSSLYIEQAAGVQNGIIMNVNSNPLPGNSQASNIGFARDGNVYWNFGMPQGPSDQTATYDFTIRSGNFTRFKIDAATLLPSFAGLGFGNADTDTSLIAKEVGVLEDGTLVTYDKSLSSGGGGTLDSVYLAATSKSNQFQLVTESNGLVTNRDTVEYLGLSEIPVQYNGNSLTIANGVTAVSMGIFGNLSGTNLIEVAHWGHSGTGSYTLRIKRVRSGAQTTIVDIPVTSISYDLTDTGINVVDLQTGDVITFEVLNATGSLRGGHMVLKFGYP